ncbi:MAG: protein kinase [Proteobacteria bacterium]|nr:protein kinase [Pseudomonadota bacterium]
MSGASNPRTNACLKCQNHNPTEAVFCGFCGASLRERKAPAPEKATLFGYVADGVLHTGAMPQPAAGPPASERAATTPERAATPGAAGAESAPLLAGRYRLGATLGRLPVGELRAASDSAAGETVTLLLVDPAAIASTIELERARRELRQLQKAASPQLLRVIDHGRDADQGFFIAIEPLKGSTLADEVAKGPLSLQRAAHIAGEVAEGLAAVQKVGVVHRDLAPENVWLLSDGSTRLLCCSVAAPIKGEIHGTAAFLSPEQATARPVDQRSNIYSLGALLHFMLAGNPPFVGDSASVLRQHQDDAPPTLVQRRPDLALADRVDALIAKAMDKSPSRRHLTLRQLLRELEAIVSPAASGEVPPPARPQPITTPVHGVTALSGGARPPSSEWSVARQPTMVPTRPPATRAAAPEAPRSAAFPSQRTGEGMTSEGSLLGSNAAITSAVAGTYATQPPTSGAAQGRSAFPSRAAEAEATIPDDLDQKQPAQRAQVPAERPSASGASGGPVAGPAPAGPAAAATAAPAAGGPGAFRETMWFFRGEVESALAEQGAAAEAIPPDAQELAEKYTDAADLSDEAAQRLSLRTGKTQMMQRPAVVPSGSVPGARMEVEDLVGEFNQGRKIGIAIGVVLAVAALATIVWLVLR